MFQRPYNFTQRNRLITTEDLDDLDIQNLALPDRLGSSSFAGFTGLIGPDIYHATLTEALLAGTGWGFVTAGSGNEMPDEAGSYVVYVTFLGEGGGIFAVNVFDGSTYSCTYGEPWRRLDQLQQIFATDELDFPSINGGAYDELTITAVGAATDDCVTVHVSPPAAGLVYVAWVSSADEVTVRATNVTASPINDSVVTVNVIVSKSPAA